MNFNFDKDLLIDTIANSDSFSEVYKKLHIHPKSGSIHQKFRKYINELGIDVSHFRLIRMTILRHQGLKNCNLCNTIKSLKEFPKKSMGRKGNSCWCNDCTRILKKRYSQLNKEHIAQRDKFRLNERTELINRIKSVPCMDCNQSFPPVCMDFDHLRDKKFSVSKGKGKNIQSVLDEIDKCDIVCANCHRIRTHNRAQYNSSSLT